MGKVAHNNLRGGGGGVGAGLSGLCAAHGRQIAKHIQRTTDDLLQVEHGSLYPALNRLERKGWIEARWELAGKDLIREYKYYRLTADGRKQLRTEESKWKKLTSAVARIMWPVEES
ncbi:MAG: PadR family transcriptional regulator [Acidobacteria bacterium]|nr:PadR family transcriptional regulator [Acidobacteriota bacterium]